jgi:hypothetical protein
MYVEEYYNDADEPETNLSITDSSTINSDKYEQKRLIKEFKNLDRGYHKLKKGPLRKHTIEIYHTSNTPDSHIRHAITGERYKWRVGKRQEEELFFAITLSTGEIPNGPYTFFYDTPEQFEKHHSIALPEKAKQKWYDRYYKTKAKLGV